MRNVAVTDGDKVEAEVKLGWTVDAWPINDLTPYIDGVSDTDVKAMADEYYDTYDIILDGRDPAEFRKHVEVQARQEIGIDRFLTENNYNAFSDHFGDLGDLKELPSLAIQRLMQKGYGFGPEGDWKTPAMVRMMKVMTAGDPNAKGSGLMEDYTYNLVPGKEGILESHMSEVDPSVADGKISIRATPLSMGDREDPARLIFTAKTGPAIATSLIDMGNRFRLIINAVDCKKVEKPMPMLPTGTVFWTPRPSLKVGSTAWIMAGGAHHTAMSYDLTADQMVDWADQMGIESLVIDEDTTIREFKRDLKIGEVYYR
jgi:L-arabinose isomerase